MPATYQSTFAPRTSVGQGLSNAMLTLFGNRTTPADKASYLKDQAEMEKLRLEAEGQQIENMMAKRAYDMSSADNIANVVAYNTGVPVPQVNQEKMFLDKGIPYAQGNPDPNIAASIRNSLAAFHSLPYMTGDTNYEQFQGGVAEGMNTQRTNLAAQGQIPVADFAKLNAASKGESMIDVQDGYAFDKFGTPDQVEAGRLSIADALVNERNSKAAANTAYANYYDERDRGGKGSGGADGLDPPKPIEPDSKDLEAIGDFVSGLIAEAGFQPDMRTEMVISERALNYFSRPESPYYGNHAASVQRAFTDMVGENPPSEQVVVEDNFLWPDVTEQRLNLTSQPLPFLPPLSGAPQPQIDPRVSGDLRSGQQPGAAPTTAMPKGQVVDQLPDPKTLREGTPIYDPATGALLYRVVNGTYQPAQM